MVGYIVVQAAYNCVLALLIFLVNNNQTFTSNTQYIKIYSSKLTSNWVVAFWIKRLLELNFHQEKKIVCHFSRLLKLSRLFILLQNLMMLLFRLLFNQMHLTLGIFWTPSYTCSNSCVCWVGLMLLYMFHYLRY